jgi:uncharacterized protein (DUF697 family)
MIRFGLRWEPTLWLQLASLVLALLVTFQLDWLTAEQAGLIVAVIAAGLGAVNAAMVRPIAPAAFTYVVQAIAALLSAYGLDFTQERIGLVQGIVVVALAMVTRQAVTPTAKLGSLSAD